MVPNWKVVDKALAELEPNLKPLDSTGVSFSEPSSGLLGVKATTAASSATGVLLKSKESGTAGCFVSFSLSLSPYALERARFALP